ncbi:MAG: peptidoglycan D,D-transpeptidase FtsI family protein [Solirubrobacteraceae bacterium]
MTTPIYRLFVLVIVLFALLVAWTSRWTVFEAKSLRDHTANKRSLFEQARIDRGQIKAADGSVLARSVKQRDGTFSRRYPQDDLFSHVIGYSFINLGRAGLEQSRNDALTGERNEITSLVDELRGRDRIGDDVITTLDPAAQRAAVDALEGQQGSIVAIEPATGKVKVMVSLPQFDPNRVPREFSKLNREDGSPLFNRATQAGYAPGSTFKVVTAIAAIDSGRFSPDSVVNGANGKVISGVPLNNSGGAEVGDISLTEALTKSVNVVWAQVGERLGKDTMGEYMGRLGFYRKPALDYPPGQRRASGEYRNGDLLTPGSRFIDVGRMAIGQDKLNVTPLQMAMVAAAVANRGKLVKPHFTDRIVDRDGRTVEDIEPSTESQVMKPETADQVTKMMTQVVDEGTGTAAALQGISVAGKTGTAEIDPSEDLNQPWFIAFAPVDNPKIAIAVTVERSTGGQGGTVAAPIAKQVLEALL